MGRHRRLTAAGFGAGILALAGASVAWACSYFEASAYVTAPREANPGDSITVNARNMSSLTGWAPDAIRIVWEQGDQTYIQDLASVSYADSFSVQVTVPAGAVKGAEYYIAAWDSSKGTRSTPATLDILNTNTNTGGGGGGGSGVGTASNTSYSFLSGGGTGTGGTASGAGPTGAGRHTGTGGGGAAERGGQASVSGAASVPSSGPVKEGIFGAPTAAPASATSATPIEGAPAQPAAGGNVPANQVLSDLWGGFARGKTTSQAPSLVSTSDSIPGPALTAGLLAAGLVVIVAGFGFAELLRRRATVSGTIE